MSTEKSRLKQNIFEGFFYIEGRKGSKIDNSTAFREDINPIQDNSAVSLFNIYEKLQNAVNIRYSLVGQTALSNVNEDIMRMGFIIDNEFETKNDLINHPPFDLSGDSLNPSAIITTEPTFTVENNQKKYTVTLPPNKPEDDPKPRVLELSTKKVNQIRTWRLQFEILSMIYTIFENAPHTYRLDIRDLLYAWFTGKLSFATTKVDYLSNKNAFEYITKNLSNEVRLMLRDMIFDTYTESADGLYADSASIKLSPFQYGDENISPRFSDVKDNFKVSFDQIRGLTCIEFKHKSYGDNNSPFYTVKAYTDPVVFIADYKSTAPSFEVFHVIRDPDFIYQMLSKSGDAVKHLKINDELINYKLYRDDYNQNQMDEYDRLFSLIGGGNYRGIWKIEIPINGDGHDGDTQRFYIVSKSIETNTYQDPTKLLNLPDVIKALKARIEVFEVEHWFNKKVENEGRLFTRFVKNDTQSVFGSFDDILDANASDKTVIQKRENISALLTYRYPTLYSNKTRYVAFLGDLNKPLHSEPTSIYGNMSDIHATSISTLQSILDGIAPNMAEFASGEGVNDLKYYEIASIAPYYPMFVVAGSDGALSDIIPAFQPDSATAMNTESTNPFSTADKFNANKFGMRMNKIYNHVQGRHMLKNDQIELGLNFAKKDDNKISFKLFGYEWVVNCANVTKNPIELPR